MREILFRGKRTDNGEWVEGYLVCDRTFWGEPGFHAYIVSHEHPSGCFGSDIYIEVDPSTVGQYTGLTDKNGKRIFEGDIVKDDSISLLGDVVFSTVGVPSFGINDVHDGLQYHDSFWHELEIIGNIHDNQELMKEEPT